LRLVIYSTTFQDELGAIAITRGVRFIRNAEHELVQAIEKLVGETYATGHRTTSGICRTVDVPGPVHIQHGRVAGGGRMERRGNDRGEREPSVTGDPK